MAAGHLPVIGDLLATNRHLEIYCYRPGCRREERLSAAEAVRLLGRDTPFLGLGKRLRCARCGWCGRNGYIEARPCTLDDAAWTARQKYQAAAAAGDADAAGRLSDQLTTLRQLLGNRGELGGDGPIGWPPSP